MQNLIDKLRAFMKSNCDEQQHALDWHERLREIYMTHQQLRNEKSALNQQLRGNHGAKK